jgi:signal transduction histidine kinase
MAEVVRVLLVDDDEDEYLITRDLFAQMDRGYELTWARGYEDARDQMLGGCYDAHLVDYHLGPQTGLELLRDVKASGCRTPILILTGAGDRSVDLDAMQAGAADYLDKSELSPALLERSLRYAIERHRNQENLDRSNELVSRLRRIEIELQGAVRTRDDFLSVASHELKTPLTALRLELDQLRRFLAGVQGVPRETFKLVDSAKRQTVRLGDLVEALLDVSRIVEGQLKLQLEEVDLVELMRDVIDRFRAQATAAESEIILSAPVRVAGTWDRMRLDQVLSNLLSNAIKYGRGKPIHVEIGLRSGKAIAAVTDQGIGIAGPDLERIFGRFERAVPSRHYGGLGLGLYIANEIVRAHGGEIVVESRRGEGSTFTIVLPQTGTTATDPDAAT